jgi:hypothetical protein
MEKNWSRKSSSAPCGGCPAMPPDEGGPTAPGGDGLIGWLLGVALRLPPTARNGGRLLVGK